MNDVRKVIYGTIIGFFMLMAVWFRRPRAMNSGQSSATHSPKPRGRGMHLSAPTPEPRT